jgi:hypothetical protein
MIEMLRLQPAERRGEVAMFVYRVELSNPITKPSMCGELMSTTNFRHNCT